MFWLHEMLQALPEAPPREAIAWSSSRPKIDVLICDMKSLTRCRQPATAVTGRGVAVGLRRGRGGGLPNASAPPPLDTAATAASISAYARPPGGSVGTTLRLFVSAGLFRGLAARAAECPPSVGSCAMPCLRRFFGGFPGGAACLDIPSRRTRRSNGDPAWPREGLSNPLGCSMLGAAGTPHTCVTTSPARSLLPLALSEVGGTSPLALCATA